MVFRDLEGIKVTLDLQVPLALPVCWDRLDVTGLKANPVCKEKEAVRACQDSQE